ncbi:MAG TPA: hypothetical protein VFY45_08660, partial [Baekduia sp.]|nr:hypothetical protein [Baekduia sp.]
AVPHPAVLGGRRPAGVVGRARLDVRCLDDDALPARRVGDPDSGKTLLLELLAAICRAGGTLNPSTAVLYRRIQRDTPTLLLDEMDNYPLNDRTDALSMLNTGYKRGAKVDRCTSTGDLESFSCFCPKAFAGLDQRAMVPTLLSRSVTIRLERKAPHEQVDRWIWQLVADDVQALRGPRPARACRDRGRGARAGSWPPSSSS